MKLRYTEEQLEGLIYDLSTITLDSHPTKHDCHVTTYITRVGDKYYRYSIEYSYNNGIQVYGDTILTPVKQVEKVVKVWVEDKDVCQS